VAALFRLNLPGHREPQLCWQGGTASGIAASARLTVQPAAQGFGNRLPEAPHRVSVRVVRLLSELGKWSHIGASSMIPMRGIFVVVCCARTANGHPAAAPPSSEMKSRRLM